MASLQALTYDLQETSKREPEVAEELSESTLSYHAICFLCMFIAVLVRPDGLIAIFYWYLQ